MLALLHFKCWSSWHPLSSEGPCQHLGHISAGVCSKFPAAQGALSQLWLLPCDGWERGCESQVGLGAADTGNGLFRELGWKKNSSQKFVIAALRWRGIRCSQPRSRSLSLLIATVCLLSYCLGIELVDEDLCYGWNCVNIWYLQHPPFSSHTSSNTVCALSVEHGVTGRSKQLEEDREAIFVTTLIQVS